MSRHSGKILALIAAGLAAVTAFEVSKVSRLENANAALEKEVADARAPKPEEPGVRVDEKELERLRAEHDELIKLRGEVTGLRREKEAWQKQAAQRKETPRPDTRSVAVPTPAAAVPAAETVDVQGATIGAARRKLLTGEALTPEEQTLLSSFPAKAQEIEKTPEQFAGFQSAFLTSLLGWQKGDPREQQLQEILIRASRAANERGYNYNSPAQTSAGWSDEQKQLDARATSVIKNLLTDQEKAVFDRSLGGVLGIDLSGR